MKVNKRIIAITVFCCLRKADYPSRARVALPLFPLHIIFVRYSIVFWEGGGAPLCMYVCMYVGEHSTVPPPTYNTPNVEAFFKRTAIVYRQNSTLLLGSGLNPIAIPFLKKRFDTTGAVLSAYAMYVWE